MLGLDSRVVLVYLAVKYEGDYVKILHAIMSGEDVDLEEAQRTFDNLKCHVMTIIDYDYPKKLKRAFRPPFVLFYYGDISLIDDKQKKLGVVGSRENSVYGKAVTTKVVGDLSKKCIVVSGLAKGIDAIAHQAIIDNGGRTVAVLGSGIDLCYPVDNEELYQEIKAHHLVISEYPGQVAPDGWHFPARNRIIAGLSDGLLVPQINQYQSGTNVSINLALNMGKTVMAIPHPIDEEVKNVTNKLILEGADFVESAEEVLATMEWQ